MIFIRSCFRWLLSSILCIEIHWILLILHVISMLMIDVHWYLSMFSAVSVKSIDFPLVFDTCLIVFFSLISVDLHDFQRNQLIFSDVHWYFTAFSEFQRMFIACLRTSHHVQCFLCISIIFATKSAYFSMNSTISIAVSRNSRNLHVAFNVFPSAVSSSST